MVILVAAAVVAAGAATIKGGKMAVNGVKKKVQDRKQTKILKDREKLYEKERQDVETERQERLTTISAMRAGSARDTSDRLTDASTSDSIKDRLANYKSSVKGGSCSAPSASKGRFSRFKGGKE
jgi:hypothetical protein